jgi:ATP-dependent Lhr-like helicase
LQRLERAIRSPARRIGLSATIGDTGIALRWLESGSTFQTPARLVSEFSQGRQIELRVNHVVMVSETKEFQAPMAPDGTGKHLLDQSPTDLSVAPQDEISEQLRELQQKSEDYYDDLFALTMRHQKTLIFTNRRNQAEQIAAELRHRLHQKQPGLDWFFVHHSSIAASWRETAEKKMRDQDQQACTIATASLELGIDIGHLDLTVQVDTPHTVSSFVQRLGRSGRRGTPSRMCFYTFEYLGNGEASASQLKQIPWNFLQTIAIIQLYLEEQWIEPPELPTMPLSLLYQQTLSILRTRTELTPAHLAQAVLTLSPFQHVTRDEYRLFLQHLLKLDQLAQMDEGSLIVGMKGGQVTGFYHFYAIFADTQDCRVLAGTQEIGTIPGLPEVGNTIGLAGYAWRVISVDEKGKTVHVERARGTVKPDWQGLGGRYLHERVMQRLRQVLQEETIYTYLAQRAQDRLKFIRDVGREATWLRSCVFRLEPGRFALFPWTGSRVYETLASILQAVGWFVQRSRSGPYYIEIVYDGDAGAVIAELRKLSPQVPELISKLVAGLKEAQLYRGKYDYLAPRTLLEKAYIQDVLDIPGTMQWLANCS